MTTAEVVGRNVARARLRLGWSRLRAAAELGGPLDDLADLENGRYTDDEISPGMLDHLAEILATTSAALIEPDSVERVGRARPPSDVEALDYGPDSDG